MMLDGKRIAILAEQDFDDTELIDTLEAMKKAGARVTVVGGDSRRTCRSLRGAVEVRVDADASQVSANYFDAVIIPGGYAPDNLRLHRPVVELVRKMHDSGKLVAAICRGPQLLITADVVRGRRVTSWPSVAVDLSNAGALWIDQPVVCDGNLITSRQPADIPEFLAAIARALRERRSSSGRPARRSPQRAGRAPGAVRPDPWLEVESGTRITPVVEAGA